MQTKAAPTGHGDTFARWPPAKMHSGGEAQNSVADFHPQYAIWIGRSEERWPSEGHL
jgi:hypothetical protein